MSKTPAIDLNSEIQLRSNRRLVQRMQDLQKDKSFHDINLIYPNSMERISSVKKLLSTHSDYFKNLFLCEGKDSYNDQEFNLTSDVSKDLFNDDECNLPFSEDIPISIFKMLHNYIFIPRLNIDTISLEDQIKLFRLTKFYQFEDVTHFMVKYFILKMTADTCWKLLNLSAESTDEHLGNGCAQTIAHLPNLVTNSELLSLNTQTLEFLLCRKTFTMQEEELIQIKKAWNEYHVNEKQSYDKYYKTLEKKLGVHEPHEKERVTMAPSTIPILTMTESNISINTVALNTVLDKVGNRPFTVISINGPKRTGKSFMLSNFVTFLQNKGHQNPNWMSSVVGTQFHWRGGSERNTVGIDIWSEPFFVTKEGREVAILLMDTQGSFDDKTTLQQNAIVFALSTLLSSTLIFNVMKDIGEDMFQFFQFFASFAKMAAQDADGNEEEMSFQKLLFLIRDMEFLDYEYGYYDDNCQPNGQMKNYKKCKLDPNPSQPEEIQFVHRQVMTSFQKVGVFALPYPGKELARKDRTDTLDSEFLYHLLDFVGRVLRPEELVTKKIFSVEVTGIQFKKYVEAWAKVLHGNVLPDVKNVYDSAAEMQNTIAKGNALTYYESEMQLYLKDHPEGVSDEKLMIQHIVILQKSFKIFHSTLKMGGKEYEYKYSEELNEYAEHSRLKFYEFNLHQRKHYQIEQVLKKTNTNNKIQIETLMGQLQTEKRYMTVAKKKKGGFKLFAYAGKMLNQVVLAPRNFVEGIKDMFETKEPHEF